MTPSSARKPLTSPLWMSYATTPWQVRSAGSVLVRDGQVHHVPLVVHRDAAFDHLLVHRVEHLVAGLGAGVRRPRERESPEGPLGDASVLLAGERHPPVFELDHFLGALLTEGLDGRCVGEVV
jgi:hypothetical protein